MLKKQKALLHILIFCCMLVLAACGKPAETLPNSSEITNSVNGSESESTVTPKLTVATEPTTVTEPTITIEPTVTTEPTVTPELTATPKPTATPELTATPKPTSTPQPTVTPKPTVTPQPTATLTPTVTPRPVKAFNFDVVPDYTDQAFIAVNDNVPYFLQSEYTTESYETYAVLDELGRCGIAVACIGKDLMPTEERGSIGSVKPSGWQTVKYDIVDGKYLYNRCHLIGFQLTAENANKSNLITGTRYLNIEGMLPFENMVADYIKETNNHVLYRVTPIFEDDNLVATGVLMEGYSVEDEGEGISYCVFCYNVQPGIIIDYLTGASELAEKMVAEITPAVTKAPTPEPEETNKQTYILNTSTHKFHYQSCSSVKQMNDENKKEVVENRDELISQGYDPCGRCKP